MNNERALNEGEHPREDERHGSIDYDDNTTAVFMSFLFTCRCDRRRRLCRLGRTGRVQGKDLNDASGQKEASDYDLGLADGADFVALRREEDDNQTLTDERNNYSSCSIRRSISLNELI